MAEHKKEKWDSEKMREISHKNNWSLAADTQLLSYMQCFSQNLLSETHSTLKILDSLESDVATTCVEVSNIGNRFWALSDTQFVESRVYDDDDEVNSPTNVTVNQDKKSENSEEIAISRLTEAIKNGFEVLDTKFETVEVSESDSEDEEDNCPHKGVVLKPVSRYRHRHLPHLIGSAEFHTDHTLGLREPASDEETEEFISASDKAYEESEDSDIECDQSKAQDEVQNQTPKAFNPQSTSAGVLDSIKSSSTASILPAEEPENHLFSQSHIFSNWQPSDLWAPEDETQKTSDENWRPGRPPSAESSVSSVQSSNTSEPAKKPNQDYGKTGSGRLPVSVQDDTDDLFSSNQSSATNKFVPVGGVKIFGGDINPFHGSVSGEKEPAKSAKASKWENEEEESDAPSTVEDFTEKTLPKGILTSKTQSRKKIDLFGDNESEDDLFSNVGPVNLNKNMHDNLGNDNNSFKVSSLPGKNKNSIKQSGHGLFANEASDDDDLFSTKTVFPSNIKSQTSGDLFSNDLFKSETDDLFGNTSQTQKFKTELDKHSSKADKTLLLGAKSSSKASDITEKKEVSATAKQQNIKKKDLFSDEVDLFGDEGSSSANDIFTEISTQNKKQSTTSIVPNLQSSKGLFEDDEGDDLFGSIVKESSQSMKNSAKDSFSASFNTTTSNTGGQTNNKSNSLHPVKRTLDAVNETSKMKQTSGKNKKALERRSLFESDSDDDLFSSPQGSLSSRKSLHTSNVEDKSTVNTHLEVTDIENSSTKAPKTDFSSIFHNETNEGTLFSANRKAESVKSSDLFEENNDLFYKSSSDIATPDLFTNSSSKTLSKNLNTTDDSMLSVAKEQSNDKINIVGQGFTTEAINKDLSLENAIKSDLGSSVSIKSDLFNDSTSDEINRRKHEPPKSLNIKPALGDRNPSVGDLSNKTEQRSQSMTSTSQTEEVPSSRDTPDGQILTSTNPSKTTPGKLKASQMLSINPAALLPGARPQQKPKPSPDSPEYQEQTKQKDNVESDSLKHQSKTVGETIHKVSPDISDNNQDQDIVSSSSLLQSVNKERVKIQNKRRPSSRRARQDAIRASSMEYNSSNEQSLTKEHSSSFNLMSPSTDEEDLFSVPPLDVIADDLKTVSPKTDIFGTPTVLSPVDKTELPSSFVSPPFVHSLPPPLDEDEEEMPVQDDDIFGYQDSSKYMNKEKNISNQPRPQLRKKEDKDDFSRNSNKDYMFPNMIDGPPPLLDDDDDNEDDEEDLFVSNKKKTNYSSNVDENVSSTTSKSLPSKQVKNVNLDESDDLFKPLPYESLKPSVVKRSVPIKLTDDTVRDSDKLPSKSVKPIKTNEQSLPEKNIFSSKSTFSANSSSYEPNLTKNDDDILSFGTSISNRGDNPPEINKKETISDALFSDAIQSTKKSSPSPHPLKQIVEDNSLITQTSKSSEPSNRKKLTKILKSDDPNESDLFANVDSPFSDNSLFIQKSEKEGVMNDDSLFSNLGSDKSNNVMSRELVDPLSTVSSIADNTQQNSKSSSQAGVNNSYIKSSHVSGTIFPDEDSDSLFTESSTQLSNSHSMPKTKNLKTANPKQETPSSVKKSTIFDDDELNADLFSVGTKKQVKTSLKTSLFGDDEDDDSIFGSTAPSSSQLRVTSTKSSSNTGAMRKEKPSSSKPVKLETKQVFSDPLLSNKD